MSLKSKGTLLPLGMILAAFATTLSGGLPGDTQPFKVTAELIGQRYCRDNDKTFSVRFKLLTRFVNQSDHRLIVEKNIGQLIPHLTIASDAKNASEEKYEYYANEDWFFEQYPRETAAQFKAPGSEFAILAPGESLQSAGEYYVVGAGPLPGLSPSRGALQPGNHVLEYLIWPWTYNTKPEEIQKQWESIGELVHKTVKVGPLPFKLPSDPKIEECPR